MDENLLTTIPDRLFADLKDKTLLVITPDFPDRDHHYIGSIFVKNQIEPLKKIFRQIIVICPVLFSFRLLPNDRYCKNYTYGNVRVFYPRCFFLPRSLPLPFVSNKQKMSFDFRYSAVRQIIRKENTQFDLIHAHFTWPSAAIAAQIREEFHVPVVTTIHEDSGWLEEEIRMEQPLLVRAWRECDRLIRVNKKDVPLLLRYNTRIISIPNGFGPEFHPMDKQESRRVLCIPAENKIVFSLAPLIERKGFSYLIDAMEQVIKKDPSTLCYIGGEGPEKKNLTEKIRKKGLQKNIFLLGFVPDKQVVRWMNSADLFVLPSLKEGNPTVMFECLGCGTPFIGTDAGGIPEIIQSDDYGYVCEPANPQALAQVLTAALGRAWDRERISQYAQQFSWEAIGRELNEVYRQLIESFPADLYEFKADKP
ncbi:glycosyl transferase, group 1 [Methanoregula boonei 6A8]|jgi:glycosyltransferase involved in cell wall biosynthesis|uniref:Glycosyl transferase, group 1 n=1 Tax=Methanoregula boonei (strain DSM 21154 / JCM 14090 / 6A8) TaxID=456442 RepID=A7I952_METB6|nr:glycosyltransferase [Methanoregula boonei]ABS56263.1 glycosyl transferase, group 1 [Methanoregula boonei 6A8]